MRVVLIMVLFIYFPLVFAEIGFRWDPDALAWSRPGLPLLSNFGWPSSAFPRPAVLDAWRKVAADLCGWKGFRGGPLLDVHGSLQLLNSSHVRERSQALLRSIMMSMIESRLPLLVPRSPQCLV